MKKLLLGMCLFIFATSCSKKTSNDDPSNSGTSDVYLNMTHNGTTKVTPVTGEFNNLEIVQ